MPSEPLVEVDLRHRLGALSLAASFQVSAPWTVLFGPSGSGKSTILRSIAGLVRPDAGRVSVLGTTMSDARTWVPPHQRPVRWAGQRPALFPHKTVRWNLGMGMDGRGSRGDPERELTLDLALSEFNLGGLANRRPGELSGGQQQMVSVARAAMSAKGRVLLLDEPFSGLDAELRAGLIATLKSWLGPVPVISVTHDVEEAFLLGAEVVRVAAGRVVAQGPVAEVLAGERERLRRVLG